MSAKFALLVFFIALLCALYIAMPSNLVDALEISDATVIIFCREYTGDFLPNGNGCIVQTSVSDFHTALKNCTQVDGVSLTFSGSQLDIQTLMEKLNVQVVTSQTVDGIVCVYGYTSKLQGGVVVSANKINIQFAYSNGTVTVGSPLILGSY